MDKFTELLDIVHPGWRYVDEESTEWRIGDRVTWEEPIGGDYVTATGTIYGFDPTAETALIYIEAPFTGDTVEVHLMHLERIPWKGAAR